jgi:chromate transporter
MTRAETTKPAETGVQEHSEGSALEVLGVATRLGLISFGGPVAHIGYFHDEYVVRRRWLDEATYADIVALCQFLPGPASSQVGVAIGILRAGLRGALAAWIGFTLPSAALLIAFAYAVQQAGDISESGPLHGLKVAAVAVVAFAVWSMARSLTPDRERATIAILATIVALAWRTPAGQVLIIVAAGVAGRLLLPSAGAATDQRLRVPIGRRLSVAAWALFFTLLIGLPLLHALRPTDVIALVDGFYRTGSLVFGGGHVVLPLIEAVVVPPGWVTEEQFLAGYGAAQAVPGPLFTFAAYLGAVQSPEPNGILGGLLALTVIFLPSFLLVIGALPIWDTLRGRPDFQSALRGVNAAVVGLLLAALYDPVWTSAIESRGDFGLALAAFGLLAAWKAPPWVVVVFCAHGGAAHKAIS